jgi:hypothetical protein
LRPYWLKTTGLVNRLILMRFLEGYEDVFGTALA